MECRIIHGVEICQLLLAISELNIHIERQCASEYQEVGVNNQ